MIGTGRLENLQRCIESVLAEGVPGDLAETGVWRGGACVFMRGVLAAYGVQDRKVWVADSFAGCPPPDARYPADVQGTDFSRFQGLAVPLEQVVDAFRRFDLLDEQVMFLRGWFRDTLPAAPIRRLAVLRLDGDLYESTWDTLTHLYAKVARGGYVIVDDYSIAQCRAAVSDFWKKTGIEGALVPIDDCAVFWRKT